MDGATTYLRGRLASIAGSGGDIEPDEMLKLGANVASFNEKLEKHVVDQGWFTEPPGKATSRWLVRGTGVIILGVVAVIAGFNLPSDGIVVLGVALGIAGVVLMNLAQSMPSRTMPCAMIRRSSRPTGARSRRRWRRRGRWARWSRRRRSR